MRIDVRDTTMWEQPVTVQTGFLEDDGSFQMEECNHAGATEESDEIEWSVLNRREYYMLCDKANCQAIKREGENSWEQTL